ncbi:MAG: PAS domain S-box protein [Deinococcales bacterium]
MTAATQPRAALLWLAAATTAYAVAFVLLAPLLGPPIMAFLLVLAALAGWWLGAARGALAAITLVALNQALALTLGDARVVQAGALPGIIPGALVAIASAVALGALRERQALLVATRQRLQEEVREGERLAATLGASEARFRMLAEEALVGVYLIQDDVFQYVNPAFARAFGYAPDEIIGRLGKLDLAAPEDHAIVRGNLQARLERAAPSEHYRFRGLRKNGSRVPVEVLGRALEVDGRPAILGTLQDRSREETDEAELRLRLSALEAAPVGIVITTPEGTIEWANHHAATLSGYTNEELHGQHTRLFGSGRQNRAFYRELWDTVTAGQVWNGELVNRRKDGSEYHEHMSINPVPSADGSVVHFVAVKQDVTERRAAEQRIQTLNSSLERQLERLKALHAIDTVITGDLELRSALARFVDVAQASLGVDALWVDLHHAGNDTVELVEIRGWQQPPDPGFRLPVGSTLVGKVVREQRSLVLGSRSEIAERFPDDQRLAREGFEVFGAAPMMARGTLRGGLAFAYRSPHTIEPDWLEFVEALATQGAILIESATLLSDLRTRNEELREAYDATIEGWSRALDLRDKETEGHSRRVTELTLRLAHTIGLPEDDLLHIRRGALLHDIGKMGVPDAILQKPGKLTEEEWRIMKRHTTAARDLLAPITFLGPALAIPYAHHERWDGTGYPEGVQGEAIPLAARIFAVADVYDALTSDRPYRPAWTRQQAIEHIRDGAGTHFDPRVVDAFLAMQPESTN